MIIEEHYVEQQLLSPQQRKLFFCEFYVILLMNIFIKRAYLASRSKLDSVLFQGGKYLEATSTLRNGDQEQHVLLQPVIGKVLSIQKKFNSERHKRKYKRQKDTEPLNILAILPSISV